MCKQALSPNYGRYSVITFLKFDAKLIILELNQSKAFWTVMRDQE